MVHAGLPECRPDATLYIWQKVPEGMSSLEFATKLLDPEVAIVTTPGEWISDQTASGHNPGDGFVRFAMVPDIEKTKEAADKLKNLKL
jgi:LL-diaminopimelate aminotransferase